MASDERPGTTSQRTRLPLAASRRRLSFEKRLRLWLYLLSLPALLLCWVLLSQHSVEVSVQCIVLLVFAAGWAFAVSLLTEQITRPLQTLSNVVAALREDDYSFRARGGRRNDAMGDLALEINALAAMLQNQRASALEAMALVERVMSSMQSPVLAFDPQNRLRLLNPAAERAFNLRGQIAVGHSAQKLQLGYLLDTSDDDLLSLGDGQQASRWVVKRTNFRLRGVPHTLLVLSDVSAALREEERIAWERLIRVLGHEINNSLTPIKSIAGSLRARLSSLRAVDNDRDFDSGLEVIENRAESLNRFLQAYRQLMGLPAPKLAPVSLTALLERVARLETRVLVTVAHADDLTLRVDADHIQQALINLTRNAAEAALSPDAAGDGPPCVRIEWERTASEVVIAVTDNGTGLTNAGNLFVPFYTTKPSGTGIGLVLAQQIAQAHRGSVQLANRSDGEIGCRAELKLPLS
ncbi:histidine kinase/DNA gyrase B/HSP90-like ATPase [Edaphobacter aggregans]|uniref:histidine kinase n=1 Tax=Edaphobacter aggregans TaxID=570835 RepID=A0A3R9QCA3_9BACT|nr:ATP-binding protein [Edaphobacter aggregans]RSL17781.1 histidine kinase/DNA gyrase B/HSP90-like ATPase [Edaphobacter aggregans]